MKIKDTLNMGKTTFPMRAGLPKNEPIWQKKWDEDHVYEQRQKLNEGKPTFMLHDGPPFANGNIHMGHALNKISKDIIVRYKSMNGFGHLMFLAGIRTVCQLNNSWPNKALNARKCQ